MVPALLRSVSRRQLCVVNTSKFLRKVLLCRNIEARASSNRKKEYFLNEKERVLAFSESKRNSNKSVRTLLGYKNSPVAIGAIILYLLVFTVNVET